MKPIKIMTDSLSDIPLELREKYDITVLPLTIIFGEEEYKDGIDLTIDQFFTKLETAKNMPRTSQVTPLDFLIEIEKALNEGYQVMIINASSQASGTHQSALMAKNQLNTDDVTVFDTMALSYGCGMIVVEAAKMAKEGKTKEEILHKINDMKNRIDHIFSVDTLEFLKRGGRLSPAKAAIGTILNVKPILTIEDGVVDPLDKVRGTKKVIPKILELAQQRGLDKGVKSLCVGHGGNPEGLEDLKDAIQKEFAPEEIITTEIGCTIGTHTGPGVLVIFYLRH